DRHHKGRHQRRGYHEQSSLIGGPSQRILGIKRNDECRSVETEPEDKRQDRSHSQVGIFEYTKLHNRVLAYQLTPDKEVYADGTQYGKKQNHRTAEPIFFLSAFKNKL